MQIQAIAIDLPTSVVMLRHRATALEQGRLRCLSRQCPFRSTAEKQNLQPEGKKHDVDEEIADSDKEEKGFECEAPAGEAAETPVEEESQTMTVPEDDPDLPRDYLVDLWPQSRPARPWLRLPTFCDSGCDLLR